MSFWALLELPFLHRWNRGRVVPMGDSAHAPLPHQGQGAGMAIEDAYVLGAILSKSGLKNYQSAFQAFEAVRKRRTRLVLTYSRAAGRAYKVVGDELTRRDQGWPSGTEHVVVGEEVVEAQVLDRSPNPPDSGRISSKLVLWVDQADLLGLQPATGLTAFLPEVVRTELAFWSPSVDRSTYSVDAMDWVDEIPGSSHFTGLAGRTGQTPSPCQGEGRGFESRRPLQPSSAPTKRVHRRGLIEVGWARPGWRSLRSRGGSIRARRVGFDQRDRSPAPALSSVRDRPVGRGAPTIASCDGGGCR